MAKRFTDTEKWNRPWYRKLGSNGRDLWNYLHENCDHAGLFDIDCEKISFILGFHVTRELISSTLRGKCLAIGNDRIFLFAFIEFQYGKLSETSKPHIAVIKKLKAENIWEEYLKGMDNLPKGLAKGIGNSPKGMDTLKDKEQDKDQDQVQEQDQDKSNVKKILPEVKDEGNLKSQSPLTFLFPKEPLIIEWLEKGDFKIQKEILNANSHHVLVEEIRKAYFYQEKREPRKADGFLGTWIRNANNRGYGLINRNSNNASATSGNPYKKQLEELRKNKASNQ